MEEEGKKKVLCRPLFLLLVKLEKNEFSKRGDQSSGPQYLSIYLQSLRSLADPFLSFFLNEERRNKKKVRERQGTEFEKIRKCDKKAYTLLLQPLVL